MATNLHIASVDLPGHGLLGLDMYCLRGQLLLLELDCVGMMHNSIVFLS